ncbi:hypothetical protein GN958_ATG12881 [Phytophthora infestans]|uniref:Uncharacterized protein n=1 Tax=Phytophthora infestans TaxID=4787 RepID=A0A8S9UHI6_PHYIN|nr:hypothetical protein GN958_ATG12881 [Phytophthora infestans]
MVFEALGLRWHRVTLSNALPGIIQGAGESTIRESRGECEKTGPKGLHLDEDSDEVVATNDEGAETAIYSSTSLVSLSAENVNENDASSAKGRSMCGKMDDTSGALIFDDTKGRDELGNAVTAAKSPITCEQTVAPVSENDASDHELLYAEEYMLKIPNRLARAKI